MKRSSLREQIFKILFRAEFNPVEEMPEQEKMFFESGDLIATDKDRAYITNKANRILQMTPEIDAALSSKMRGWTLDRVGRVELAILRLGVYEIVYDDDVPVGVAISEAVELARKFGAENSGAFVNGVLAKFDPERGKAAAASGNPEETTAAGTAATGGPDPASEQQKAAEPASGEDAKDGK